MAAARPGLALRLVLAALCAVRAQQQAFDARGAPEPASLARTALAMFDKDRSGSVTLKEASATLEALAALSSMGTEPGKGPSEMEKMIDQAKRWLPQLFKLLDADGSGHLAEPELEWIETGLEAAKNNIFRNITRDIFELIDTDGDAVLSLAELETVADSDIYSKVVAIILSYISLPTLEAMQTSDELQTAFKENVKAIIASLDGNGDGSIDRKEAGVAVGTFKRAYIKAVEAMKTMGPMLAMFGGGDMGMPMSGPAGRKSGGRQG